MTKKNPVGTNGFAFVEFASPEAGKLEKDFSNMGFTLVAEHKQKPIKLYRQGDINFLVNSVEGEHGMSFAKQHGSAAVAMGFKVRDAKFAQNHALQLDAKISDETPSLNLPHIEGVGGSLLYFIDEDKLEDFFKAEFYFNNNQTIEDVGLTYIDHLTHNVNRGQMKKWSEFYERIFGFYEIRHFNIQGKMTGLVSQAMTSPCGKIRIPINEATDDKSQIEEFLQEFHGEGIQHIALGSSNIYHSIEKMRGNGIIFLDTPDVYFDQIKTRLPWQNEDVEALRKLKILIDGLKTQEGGLLLQIFTENMLGPVFFEIIQRKGNEGFGEGNFQALFEAMELDQMKRGKL